MKMKSRARKERNKKWLLMRKDWPSCSPPPPPPTFWAGGSHNKTCWVKYLCEINSCDNAVMRDGGAWGGKKRHCKRVERKCGFQWGGESPPGCLSAASRLVAIHYPAQLKYYAHWLMLTVWPEGGERVGKCVCLRLCPAVSNPISAAKVLRMTWLRSSWGFLKQMFTRQQRENKLLSCFVCFLLPI